MFAKHQAKNGVKRELVVNMTGGILYTMNNTSKDTKQTDSRTHM